MGSTIKTAGNAMTQDDIYEPTQRTANRGGAPTAWIAGTQETSSDVRLDRIRPWARDRDGPYAWLARRRLRSPARV